MENGLSIELSYSKYFMCVFYVRWIHVNPTIRDAILPSWPSEVALDEHQRRLTGRAENQLVSD